MNVPAGGPAESRGNRRIIGKSWRWLLGLLGLALAWHAFKEVAWDGVWHLLTGLSPLAIVSLLAINLLMLPLMAARWWLLLTMLGSPVAMGSACAYRVAANAVSYLTPGPHFGGEPLSVYLLHRREGISLSAAAASVAVDRLLELMASMVVLTFCLTGLACAPGNLFSGRRGVFGIIAALVLTGCVLAALFSGKNPLSRPLHP